MKSNAISNKNGQIYCLGEALLDIVFSKNSCKTGHPGGAMLNSSVTLSRSGLPVNFTSLAGMDLAGDFIVNFLIKNNISVEYLVRHKNIQTTLALAFINQNGDASYSFYKDSLPEIEFKIPNFSNFDIVLFGSGWARESKIFNKIHSFLNFAQKSGAMIIYDPNFRKKGSCTPAEVLNMCQKNIAIADLVRGSDEDFYNLFGVQSGQDAFKEVQKSGCNFLIYTVSNSHIECFFDNQTISLPVEKVKIVNTVGAGDNFNAGIIKSFFNSQIQVADLPSLQPADWLRIISSGRAFGSAVCQIEENYLSKKMIKLLKV